MDKEDWINRKWRPMMGWVYMVTCTMDFIVFPVLWAILTAVTTNKPTPWEPITLQGAGLYHLAMGAILGITAYSRGKEKIAGISLPQHPLAEPPKEKEVVTKPIIRRPI